MSRMVTTGNEILDITSLDGVTRPSMKTEADRRRILLVDDDRDMRDFLGAMLGGEGFLVDSVASCLDGFLHVIRSYYHCMILDLLFPEVDGLFLYEQVKRLDPDLALRTVLITGSDDSNPLLQRARQFKMPILEKPVANQTLVDHLRRFCGDTVN